MNDRQELIWRLTPVPTARAGEHFSATEVGQNEYVFLDNERLEYHTLNASALSIWQLCDGIRTSPEIADALAQTGHALPVEAVELAIADLGDAGLLDSAPWTPSGRVDRRQVMKLTAAGVLGAAVMPIVSSITAPVALANHTCGVNGTVAPGGHCVCDSECGAGNCCCGATSTSSPRTCGNRSGNSSNCSGGSLVCLA